MDAKDISSSEFSCASGFVSDGKESFERDGGLEESVVVSGTDKGFIDFELKSGGGDGEVGGEKELDGVKENVEEKIEIGVGGVAVKEVGGSEGIDDNLSELGTQEVAVGGSELELEGKSVGEVKKVQENDGEKNEFGDVKEVLLGKSEEVDDNSNELGPKEVAVGGSELESEDKNVGEEKKVQQNDGEKNEIGDVGGEVKSDGIGENLSELGAKEVAVGGSELVFEDKNVGLEKKVEGLGSYEVSSETVEDGEKLGGGNENDESGSLETDGMIVTSEGIVVMEEINVDTLSNGVAVVGDVDGSKDLEIKELENVVDPRPVPADNKFDESQDGVEEVVERAGDVNIEAENDRSIDVNAVVGDASLEMDVAKVTSEGDVVLEEIHGDVLRNRVAVVGDVEGSKDLEIKELENVVNPGTVPVDNKFDKIQAGVEEVVEPACDANIEAEKGRSTDVNVVVGNDWNINEVDAGIVENGAVGGNKELATEAQQEGQVLDDQEHENDESKNLEKVEDEKADEPKSESLGKTEAELEAGDEKMPKPDEEAENDTDDETDGMIFGSSEAAKRFLEELERASGSGVRSSTEDSRGHSEQVDGQIVRDSEEETDTDDEGDGEGEEKELFDSAALTALLKAATGASSDGGTITVTSQDGSRLFSVERPAGLGSSLQSMRPAPRSSHSNLFGTSGLTASADSDSNLSVEDKKKLEKLQQIRVKFLRLVHRLGYSPEESTAAQVLYRLAVVAGRQGTQLFSVDAAKNKALELETAGKDDLNFSLNILVLGKAGVGKSATINSIFGEEKCVVHSFEPSLASARIISGMVDGVKISVIDTPGLKSSGSEQGANRKILSSVKKCMKKCSPDIVLYIDRLDSQTRDLNDLPLLRSITGSLGSSIWRNAIVTLTHAASAPPDGPSGSPLSYEVFVAQRSHVVQQLIGQAVGDLRLMNPSLMNPLSLAENHPSCRKNRDGQKVLPNGQAWKPQLLLLCYSMKILSEASSLSKPQEPLDHRKLFGFRMRSPPLPYLLSWLLQSRTHPKLATDQGGDSVDSDVDLADLSDADEEEEEDEYDQLPPFKPLRKSQLAKLSREQRKAYLEEYDYRVKLLQKKQWKEELKRMKEMKKGKTDIDEYAFGGENVDPENEGPAAVPVPLPDMVLPPSFDADNPAYRYRFLEPTSQFLARPVLDTHGWDHDCGYDGVNLEHSLAIINRFPAAVTVQVTKDKKEFNIHMDSSVSTKHGENGSSMAGFDIQQVGKQLAYTVRGETKFKSLKKNKTAAGVSVTFLGENVAKGFKIEDQIALGKRLVLVGSTGTIRSQSDSAYGANIEVRLREADFPIGQDQSSLGLSLVKWRGDLALGANLQSQISVGRSSKVAIRAGLNNKMSGQISVRTSSSEQLQLALVALLPIAMSIYKFVKPGAGESYFMY